MRTEVSQAEIGAYRKNGFIVIEDFLNAEELATWREAIFAAVAARAQHKLHEDREGWDAGDGYYDKVFIQRINLWRDNPAVKALMLDPRIAKLAAELEGVDGMRVWHDQALFKPPWGNPTAWHLDVPYWSFDSLHATSIWIALDDATVHNGCMFFLPGTHKRGCFDNVSIGENMGAIFEVYPEFAEITPAVAQMPAGGCSFHNGLTVHGANANMTPGWRRAMTCGFMPDGCAYNGKPNILSPAQAAALKVGDPLNDEEQNPLLYHRDA